MLELPPKPLGQVTSRLFFTTWNSHTILFPHHSAAIKVGQRRFVATKPEISTTFLTMGKNQSFRKAWLSDPSTYPVIGVLGAACGLCAGVGLYNLAYNKDVQIAPAKRNSILRI
jgi:hypothetical protein